MKQTQSRRLRVAVILAALFIVAFGLVQPGRAQGIIYGDTIPAGEVVENDAILFGDDVVVDGTVAGDLLAIGRNVTINGDVEGSLVFVGENVTVNGNVLGTVYSAGVMTVLEPETAFERNMYFAGVNLETKPGSTVARDLNALCLGVTLDGEVGRDVNAIIGPVNIIKVIINWVNDLSGQVGLSLTPDEMVLSSGDRGIPVAYLYPASAGHAFSDSLISKSLFLNSPEGYAKLSTQKTQGAAVANWLLSRLRYFITLMVIGLIGIWLLPSKLNQSSRLASRKPWSSLGIGFVVLIVGFAGAVLLGILLILLGVVLGVLTLWDLAFILTTLGFATLGFAFAIFVFMVIYGSKVIVAYMLGMLILGRLIPRAAERRIWPLLLGVFIYVILMGIPYLNWFITILATLIGLGSAWFTFRNVDVPTVPAGPAPEIPAEAPAPSPEMDSTPG